MIDAFVALTVQIRNLRAHLDAGLCCRVCKGVC